MKVMDYANQTPASAGGLVVNKPEHAVPIFDISKTQPVSASSSLSAVLEECILERDRQDRKWGASRNMPNFFPVTDLHTGKFLHDMPVENRFSYYNIPTEEDVKSDLEKDAKRGKINWYAILLEEVVEVAGAKNEEELEKELIQVMAVSAAWLQNIRQRREGKFS
jgi:hypothetical protein